MTTEEMKEKLMQFVGEKIIEESEDRNQNNNLISSVSLHGIELGDDGYPLISDAIRNIYVSERVTYAYFNLMSFIQDLELQNNEEIV